MPNSVKPASLAQFRKEIETKKGELAAINRQQYEEMLKGGKPDSLNALKAQRESALKELQVQYAQAMGLGEKKPRNQLQGSRMTDEYRETMQQRMKGDSQPGSEANEEKNFWDGFRKGLGLNEGEEVGGGLREVGLAAQNTAAHMPGLTQDYYFYNEETDKDKYYEERQQRQEALSYNASEDFVALVTKRLKIAQTSLEAARGMGNAELIAQCEETVALYETIAAMYTNVNTDNALRYSELNAGLEAVQRLVGIIQEEMSRGENGLDYDAGAEYLAILNEEVIAINRGMNVVGEAYLDDIDELYKKHEMSRQDYTDAYRDYYASVIERESLIEIESRSLNEDNLTIANDEDSSVLDVLQSNDVPLYTTVEDAVLAFKQEAMPLTLETNLEHSALLDSIEVLDTETGEVQTYYYYLEVKQGAGRNVIWNAMLGAGGGEDRMLLHTHPVEGYWGRNFSGDPENDGLNQHYFEENVEDFGDIFNKLFAHSGDSSVPNWLGYGGIYVIGSGGEVKLHEGHGEVDIGSGHNTYANTLDELQYISTIDLY